MLLRKGMLFFFKFLLILLLFRRKSNLFNSSPKPKFFFSFFDIFCWLSHLFEPIFMQRFNQNLNSDFFIFVQIWKCRQDTIHRICLKRFISLEWINTLFSQSKLSSGKVLSCLQKFWLLDMSNYRSRIKRSNHLFNSYDMIFWHSKDKFNHFLFNQNLHTNRIISKLFIFPSAIKNRIKILINLIHQFNILFHRLNMVFCINIWATSNRIFRDLHL